APQGGIIDWSGTATDVDRLLRAFWFHPFRSPWGHAKTELGDVLVEVLKASRTTDRADAPPGSLAKGRGSEVRVACADGWMRLDRVRIGGRPAHTTDLLRVGARFTVGPH